MKKYRFKTSGELIEAVDSTPVCGKDFCDSCGDCLSCHWEDTCYGNDDGEHYWVEYVDEEDSNG